VSAARGPPVGVQAEHPAAQRAHQEADREDHRGRQQLRGGVVAGKNAPAK
jgi:hypothetical protein